MTLIDTHAHLYDKKFANDLADALARARAAELSHIVVIGTTAEDSEICVQLSAEHAMLFAAVGIQPNHVADAKPGDWDQILRLVEQPKVVAVGETGLDRYWDYAPFDQQEEYFARHLELARKQNLAVVIHCREAEADVIRMLRDDYDRHGPVRGVMHSFCGDAESAKTAMDMGLYISIAGMVTYKKADNVRDMAKTVPLEKLLVETDSPYLAPEPKRGKRNEPAFVAHTAAFLADLFTVDVQELARHTTANARDLFGWKE